MSFQPRGGESTRFPSNTLLGVTWCHVSQGRVIRGEVLHGCGHRMHGNGMPRLRLPWDKSRGNLITVSRVSPGSSPGRPAGYPWGRQPAGAQSMLSRVKRCHVSIVSRVERCHESMLASPIGQTIRIMLCVIKVQGMS
jgi:hypothetical protein